MICETYGKLLNEFVDGRCDRAEEVARHVERCAECAAALRELRAVRDAVSALPGLKAPEDLRRRVMSSVRERRPARRSVWRLRVGMAGATAVALAAAVYFGLPRSQAAPMLEAEATFAVIEEMHTHVQLAYALPADSPSVEPAPPATEPENDDMDFLYDFEGM